MRKNEKLISMGRSVQAFYVNPEILKWARETSGYDKKKIAKRINVSVDKLQKIEKGEESISIAQLRSLSQAYKRPTAIFYLKEVPQTEKLPDLRKNKIEPIVSRSDESLDIKVREMREYRKNALNMGKLLEINPNYEFLEQFSKNQTEKDIARNIRKLLNVNTNELKTKRDHAVLNYWKEKIEQLNIMIFQFQRIDLEVARGFVLSEKPYPLIALNSGDSYYARVFTLLHEFCHILLNQTALCSSELISHGADYGDEIFCNKIASLVLVPEDELLHKNEELEDIRDIKIKIERLSKIFKVSYSVVVFSLDKFQLISKRNFDIALNWIKSKEERRKKEPKRGKPDYYTVFFSKTSNIYLKLLFHCYYDQKIDFHNALSYSGEKLNTFEKIEKIFLEETV